MVLQDLWANVSLKVKMCWTLG